MEVLKSTYNDLEDRKVINSLFSGCNNGKKLKDEIINSKKDNIFMVPGMFMMTSEYKNIIISNIDLDELKSSYMIYNFISEFADDNKETRAKCDAIVLEILKTHKKVITIINKQLNPIEKYFTSKFTHAEDLRGTLSVYTNLPLLKSVVDKFNPDLDHYDPVSNAVYI
jgi:hypothetical protein